MTRQVFAEIHDLSGQANYPAYVDGLMGVAFLSVRSVGGSTVFFEHMIEPKFLDQPAGGVDLGRVGYFQIWRLNIYKVPL